MISNSFTKEIEDYCAYYNLPIKHLASILSDLKVIPMIRGKGFEFTVSDFLRVNLDKKKWIVSNPNLNAQSEIHDVDVYVTRKKDNKQIRIECKLSGKDSFRVAEGHPQFKVKCMRSRTVSDNEMATRMAKRYDIPRAKVVKHPDQYRHQDFDFVITSMGNAFWTTEDRKYIFSGSEKELKILSQLFPKHFKVDMNKEQFRDATFNFLLIANSKKMTVKKANEVVCTRKKCIQSGNAVDCGFIPNYPVVNLTEVSTGSSPWKINSETNLDKLFSSFLDKPN